MLHFYERFLLQSSGNPAAQAGHNGNKVYTARLARLLSNTV